MRTLGACDSGGSNRVNVQLQSSGIAHLRTFFYKLIISRRITLSLLVLFIFLLGTFAPNLSFSQSASISNNIYHPLVPPQHHDSRCNCVVFRMDDVQDYWHDPAQIAAMNLFISKNQSLSTGIIMRGVGNDSKIVDKVAEGNRKGLFELALHGWDHIDYTKLSGQQQRESLRVANEKMARLFGYPSDIFVTPYGPFNNDTIQAMKQIGLSILSASTPDEERFDHSRSIFHSGEDLSHSMAVSSTANTSAAVYHLPAMTFFGIDENGTWIPARSQRILSDVDNNIVKYGYAVIVFHPQDLVQKNQTTGKLTNLLNASRVKDLSSLIDSIVSKKIPISSLSKIVGVEDQSYHHNLAPLIRINMRTNSTNGGNHNGSSIARTIILTFDDNWKSQYTNAIPILDKYGFKASFFVVCNYVGRDNNTRMNWQDVLSLQNDGMDIESHTMNHKDLNKLSAAKLDYEVGQSKQCLHSHGVTGPTIMATPFNEGWNNATVINTIAKYYELARSGNSDITFLHCDKWNHAQTDCRTYFANGTLTYANRYSIMAWNHNFYDNTYMHNGSKIFNKFIQVVNKQTSHNTGGIIDAIPIVEYHNVANDNLSYSTNVDLFSAEMKYLHDNGFKAITMSDILYNDTSNFLYLKKN